MARLFLIDKRKGKAAETKARNCWSGMELRQRGGQPPITHNNFTSTTQQKDKSFSFFCLHSLLFSLMPQRPSTLFLLIELPIRKSNSNKERSWMASGSSSSSAVHSKLSIIDSISIPSIISSLFISALRFARITVIISFYSIHQSMKTMIAEWNKKKVYFCLLNEGMIDWMIGWLPLHSLN